MTPWLIRIGVIVLMSGGIAYEYASIQSAGFVFEDPLWMASCPHRFASIRRSLTQWSWCKERDAGHSARTFHAVNIALHLTVSLLLGILTARLCRSEILGWAAAALFALQPMAIESAMYIAGRGELIAALGVMLASLSALEGYWLLAVASLALGIAGKETAIVGVIAMVLVLRAKHVITDKTVHVVGVGMAAFVLAVVWYESLTNLSLIQRLAWAGTQAASAIGLLAVSVTTLGQTPTHDFVTLPIAVVCVATCVYGSLPLWAKYAQNWRVSFGLNWIFWTVVPRLLVPTPNSPLNEHQFYVPLMGLPLMTASLWSTS